MTVSRGIARGALDLTPCASRASEFLHIGPSGRHREEDAEARTFLITAMWRLVPSFTVCLSSGRSQARRCTQATHPEKLTTCPFALLRGHYLVRIIGVVRMLGCAIPFR